MKKKWLIGMLLAFVMVFASACSSSSKETGSGGNGDKSNGKVTINFWTMQLKPTFTDYINGMISDFEKQNPNIKVKWLDVPASDLEQKMLSAVSSHTAPDVVNLPVGFSTKLVSMDALVHMDKALTKEEQDKYLKGAWGAYTTQDGVRYGIPWYVATDITMYNADLFKKAGLDPNNPPKTFEEAAKDAKTIKEKTGKYGFYPSLDLSLPLQYMVMMGAPLLNKDGTKAAFNTPEGLHMFKYFTDLYKKDLIPHSIVTDDEQKGVEKYAAGEVAMFSEGPQFLTQVKDNGPDAYKATKTSEAITGKSGKKSMTVQGLVIPKQTKHEKAAVKFALFVTNAKNQVAFSKLTPVFPSVEEALKDPFFTKVPKNAEPVDYARISGAKQLKDAEVLIEKKGNEDKWDDLQQAMFDALQKSMLGKESPKQALDEAEKQWNQILSE